jgi:hypothetical protein
VELVLVIFHHCDPAIKSRLKLTHTCRRWRRIALKNASLWTRVNMIVCDHRRDETTFSNFLSLLDMQFDRAGGLLLDVIWIDDVISEWNSRVIQIIQQKAPISRWRSLTVCLWGRDATPDNLFGPNDAFTNLKELSILCRTVEPVIRAMDRLTTSKLQVLDLNDWYLIHDLEDLYFESLNTISTLILPKRQNPFANNYFLPPNVTNLQANWRHGHPFPHLQTYKLMQCTFRRRRLIDLRNLTSLVVTAALEVYSGCEVKLPSLLHFTHATIRLGSLAKFEAPLLETLHIKVRHPSEISHSERIAMDAALRHPGYRLSAKRSLIVEWRLSEKNIARLLELSPQVEHLSLWFVDSSSFDWLMGKVIGVAACSASPSPDDRPGTLCPSLKVLKVYFLWDTEDKAIAWNVKYCKEMTSAALKTRMTSGMAPEIYATWKELCASVRLA